jgi:hypothetical protein
MDMCKSNATKQITQTVKTTPQKANGTKEDHWRDFCMCEIGTGQQVVQVLAWLLDDDDDDDDEVGSCEPRPWDVRKDVSSKLRKVQQV